MPLARAITLIQYIFAPIDWFSGRSLFVRLVDFNILHVCTTKRLKRLLNVPFEHRFIIPVPVRMYRTSM